MAEGKVMPDSDDQIRSIQRAARERIAQMITALHLSTEEQAFAELLGHELTKQAMEVYAATVLQRGLSTKVFRPLCAAAALAYALTAADEFVKRYKVVPEQ